MASRYVERAQYEALEARAHHLEKVIRLLLEHQPAPVATARARRMRTNRHHHIREFITHLHALTGTRPPVQAEPPSCGNCAKWKADTRSETGGQCLTGEYRKCRPWAGEHKHWEARDGQAAVS